jgi:small-conductance mechanosensitive channel
VEERAREASDELQTVKDFLRAIAAAGALRATAFSPVIYGQDSSAVAAASGVSGSKVLLTAAIALAAIVASALLRRLARVALADGGKGRALFWADQVVKLLALAAFLVASVLLWSRDLSGLGGSVGVLGAGVAVALQRVITSFAAYLIIIRGKVFSVGDRVTFGGVRGDVIALGFMQTTVLEMGQSPPERQDEPATWVRGRQYTGRVVRVTNDKIFDFPVYNYTREFPFVWDEIMLPIGHDVDTQRAEAIMLDAARKHGGEVMRDAKPALERLRKVYYVEGEVEIEPRVYLTVNDNYTELALRFLSREPGVRLMKDALYRDILNAFHQANIAVASTSMEIAVPDPVEVKVRTA